MMCIPKIQYKANNFRKCHSVHIEYTSTAVVNTPEK